jgi:four helix bundle protein
MKESKQEINHFRELEVYRRSFSSAMTIFEVTKLFPAEEKYSLVDQIRRSSRSVCACLAEAWRKRRYQAVFKNKLTDAMQEASETQCWLEVCAACNYLSNTQFADLDREYENIIGMLSRMEDMAHKFCYGKE